MAKSIIPKFQLNLSQPAVSPYTDYSASSNTQSIAEVPDVQTILKMSKQAKTTTAKKQEEPEPVKQVSGLALISQNGKRTYNYFTNRFRESTANVLGAAFNAPAAFTRTGLNVVGTYLLNPIYKALGMEAANFDKTLSQMLVGAVKEVGSSVGLNVGIDTSSWKPGFLKNFVDDAQNGTNVFYGMADRAAKSYGADSEKIKAEVDAKGNWLYSLANDALGSTATSMPISAQYIAGGGLALVTGASQNMTEAMNATKEAGGDANSTIRAAGRGVMQTNIDVFTEMMFGLYGEVGALFNTPVGMAAKNGLSSIMGKLGKKTAGKIITSLFALGASSGEESLEELVAYPFQQLTNYLYDKADGSVADFKQYFSFKDFTNAGLMGFLTGAVMGTGSLVKGTIVDAKRQAKLKKLGIDVVDILNTSPDDPSFEAKAVPVIDEIAKMKVEQQKAEEKTAPGPGAKGRKMTGTIAPKQTAIETPVTAPTEPTQAEPEGPPPADQAAPEDIPTTAVRGKTGKAVSEAGTAIDFEYQVVSASDLISSMDEAGNVNPKYSQELQPRDTDRAASKLKIEDIYNKTNPERLGENPMVGEGAPVVGSDYQVEMGNHRVSALKKGYKNKSAGMKKYVAWLTANAEKFGINPANLPKNPILIRVRQTEVDRVKFAQEGNIPTTQQMSAPEKAKIDADKLTPEILAYFKPTEEGEVANPGNLEFIRRFINEVVPANDRNTMVDAQGNPSEEGIRRIRNALFQAAYGNVKLLGLISESTDNHIKRMTNALVAVAPKVLQVKRGIAAGQYYDLDFGPAIAGVAEQFADMKKAKQNIYIFATQQVLGETAEQIQSKKLLMSINAFNSAKKLTEFFSDLLDAVVVAGDPRDVGLFGALGAPVRDDVIEAALRRNQVEKAAELQAKGSDGQLALDEAEPADAEEVQWPELGPEQGQAVDPEVKEPAKPVEKPSEPAKFKREPSVKVNPDGTYNLAGLEESARRIKLAMAKADRGQRSHLDTSLKGLNVLIDYVKENPGYIDPKWQAKQDKAKEAEKKPASKGKTKAAPKVEAPTVDKVEKPVDKPAEPVKRGDYVSIDGQGVGLIENAYDDGAFNVDINGLTYHRSGNDTDYKKVTAAEYWTDLKRQIQDLKDLSSGKRKQAADYNKATDGAAVARKGKIQLAADGRPIPFSENPVSANHRSMLTEAGKAADVVKKLTKQMDDRKARLERDIGYGLSYDANEAKALGIKASVAAKSEPEPVVVPTKGAVKISYAKVKGLNAVVISLDSEPTETEKNVLRNNMFKPNNGLLEWYAPANQVKDDTVQDIVADLQTARGINQIAEEDDLSSAFSTPDKDIKSSEALGAVAAAFQNLNYGPSTNYKVTGNARVDAALDAATTSKNKSAALTWLQDTWEGIKNAKNGDIMLDRGEYGNTRWLINQLRNAGSRAASHFEVFVRSKWDLDAEQYRLLRDYMVFSDMMEDIQNGTWDQQAGLAFEVGTPLEAAQFYMKAKTFIEMPANTLVKNAADAYYKTLGVLQDKLIAKGLKIGVDLTHILKARSAYMYHAVQEYVNMEIEGIKNKGRRDLAYKKREGSIKAYLTDPAKVAYLTYAKMMRDMAAVDLAADVKKRDIYHTLLNKDGSLKPIPAGYAQLTMNDMRLVYDDTLKVLAQRNRAKAYVAKHGNTMTPKEKARMLSRANKARPDVMIVPIELRDAILEEYRFKASNDPFFEIAMKVTQGWKVMRLYSPAFILKYNMKNLMGDTDALIMTYPDTLLPKYTVRAIKELALLYRHGQATEMMSKYIDFGGLTTNLANYDIETIQMFEKFRFNPKAGDKSLLQTFGSAWTGYWKGAKDASEFREQLLRYAAFLNLHDKLEASQKAGTKGLPKNYGASVPWEIQAVKNWEVRAFKLSQDALGNYGDITMLGKSFAKFAWPFVRFTEVNTKRYFRMFRNAFYTDPNIAISTGRSVVDKLHNGVKVSLMALWRVGRLALLFGAYQALFAFWNRVVMREADDALPEEIRKGSHLTIGYLNGKVRYLNDLSSFAQFYNQFGMEGTFPVVSDILDIVNGRTTFADKVKDLIAPVDTFINGINPIIKMPFELATGKSTYPSVLDTRSIRDRWEYVMNAAGFGNAYKILTDKPQQNGNPLETLTGSVFNSVNTGDAALWDIYDLKDKYLKSIGEAAGTGRVTAKSNAFYYYKVALKVKDSDAALKYLTQYYNAGGTMKSLKASMENLDPIASLTKKQKTDFLASLSPEDAKRLEQAQAWVADLKELSAENEFEVFTSK